MSDVIFSGDALDDYMYWQRQDTKTLKRINKLLTELQRTPFEGTGKPEPLSSDKSGEWSRRIDEQNRIAYECAGGTIRILRMRGHYGDK